MDKNERMGTELAQAFMAAYDEALNHSFGNEQYAMNVAMGVTFAISQQISQKQTEITAINRLFSGLVGFGDDEESGDKKNNNKGRRKNNG